jgi:hypothetical protein
MQKKNPMPTGFQTDAYKKKSDAYRITNQCLQKKIQCASNRKGLRIALKDKPGCG